MKSYLFFFVHPSKYHVFKHTINYLLSKGHHVDVVITSKDVLQQLVSEEGWSYTNIFPKGRKIKGLPTYLGAFINLVRTISRLMSYTRGKKYDLFITDDLLTIIGRLKGVPSILFQDSDLKVVPESALLLIFASHILSPACSNMGIFNYKKIGYNSYKELAYLHPDYFTPNSGVVKNFNPSSQRYFLIRLVSLRATHDVGRKGISNEMLQKLIIMLNKYGKVFISSERNLPVEFECYRLQLKNTTDILQAIYFADLFIGDSQTTTSEAAVLGTPAIRINDFVGSIPVMEEKEEIYGLTYGYKTDQFEKMFEKVHELCESKNLKEEFHLRKNIMLNEKINLTPFMQHLFEYYPESIISAINQSINHGQLVKNGQNN